MKVKLQELRAIIKQVLVEDEHIGVEPTKQMVQRWLDTNIWEPFDGWPPPKCYSVGGLFDENKPSKWAAELRTHFDDPPVAIMTMTFNPKTSSFTDIKVGEKKVSSFGDAAQELKKFVSLEKEGDAAGKHLREELPDISATLSMIFGKTVAIDVKTSGAKSASAKVQPYPGWFIDVFCTANSASRGKFSISLMLNGFGVGFEELDELLKSNPDLKNASRDDVTSAIRSIRRRAAKGAGKRFVDSLKAGDQEHAKLDASAERQKNKKKLDSN